MQGLASSQSSGTPPAHPPPWQNSNPLHTLPSLQETPSGRSVYWHPNMGSQLSIVQGLVSSQLSGAPGEQVPLWQVSTPLQTLPSLHELPSGTGELTQPTTGSHVSVVQALASSHQNVPWR